MKPYGLVLAALLVTACKGDDDASSDPDAAPDDSTDAAAADPDAAPAATPETCADVQAAAVAETGVRPPDGTYTLYVEGDADKPWEAFCQGMNLDSPIEYLTVDEDDNVSQLSNGVEVAVTRYRRYRIDPVTLTIDPLDGRFNTTTNESLVLPGLLDYLPAGFAEFSSDSNDDGPAAEAEVDLAGTSFAFHESVLDNDLADFFCTTNDAGDSTGSTVTVDEDLTRFTLSAINDTADATTRTVADCDHLSDIGAPFAAASWPLTYVAP
ncbi:MAG TPA: GON domain-containing protein [Kofleriaceae bacterium]|nr:GON domain-containing protein [Kofleriaceae bacterium]